jgi:protein TonB
MELKKSNKANLDKRRGLFLEVGLLIALGFALLAFEWQVAPKEEVKEEVIVQGAMEMEEIVPITRQEETPPPPPPEPPKVTDILDIVSDDVHVDTNVDINMEADFSTEIVPVVFDSSVGGSGVVIEEEEEVVIFAIVEDKPTFQGKEADAAFREWVGKTTVYPAVAQENGITGRVFTEFTIDKDGTVTDIKVMRGVDPLLDAEAVRVLKLSPKWSPGMQRGKPVKVKYTFPFNFQLNN